MEEILDFLIEVGKLKRMPRRGWVINQINNPESIAEHVFRATIMGWILGEKKSGLNVEKILKMALIHDLCEIYAGDTTPYDSVLPRSKKKLKELMKTWPRFPTSIKKELVLKKHKKETEALEKLISKLPPYLKKEIKTLWLDYERGLTAEGRFFHQADRMENFLQAYEYWRKYKNPPLGPWWLWAREFFDDPILLEFMEVLEKKFHQQKISKKIKPFMTLLNFFSKIGKLKRKPRRGWLLRGVRNPETIAEYIFETAIISWLLSRKKKKFNMERTLKIALSHELSKVYAKDITPYDKIIFRKKKIRKKIFKEWLTTLAKIRNFYRNYKEEYIALKKLTRGLPFWLKKEIINLWDDYQRGLTKEGRFVYQTSRIENLLQALEYFKKDKNFPIESFWKEAEQFIDAPILVNFLKTLRKSFIQR
jgi:putative hydrolase of HD superfamily